MKEYIREYPQFSLCGLNCGLCPRYQSKGASRCPGCGGEEFHLKHPSCAVITCSKKHDNVEYCFQCAEYPCDRYINSDEKDSFISYQKVCADFENARRNGIEAYKAALKEKIDFLKFLIENYNDGRKTSFYCNAVNLLSLVDIDEIKKSIEDGICKTGTAQKEKITAVTAAVEELARSKGIDLKLRK